MNETSSSPGGPPESPWAWIAKPWPWGQLTSVQILLALGLIGLNETRARRGLPRLDALEACGGFLFLCGLATGAFAFYWSRRLERMGRTLPTYRWLTNLLGGIVAFWMIGFAIEQGRPSQPALVEASAVPESPPTEAKGTKTLRTVDGQFEVDVPASWVVLPPSTPWAYGTAMTDPAGSIGVGLYLEPRPGSAATDTVTFGEQHLKAFSAKFDEVTVLESTASFRPGYPPLRQIVEARSGGERRRFALIYGETSTAFFQVRIWGPASEFHTHESQLREIVASFRAVP